jgi:uncharacterized phage protein (TIGR01671 family)
MREIKFRAWDKERNMMIGKDYPKNWGDEKDEWYADVHMMDLVGIEGISSDDQFEVMQYTGLKDKNGKEIYEGDITKEEFNSGIKNCEVVFESGGFFIKNEKAEILDNLHWHSNGLVVIGNIHENPELLEVIK